MEKEYYVVVMLCKDNDNYYVDNISLMFEDIEVAKEQMFICANNEYQNLIDVGNFEIVNLNDEIVIYDENRELVTKYEIIKVRKKI